MKCMLGLLALTALVFLPQAAWGQGQNALGNISSQLSGLQNQLSQGQLTQATLQNLCNQIQNAINQARRTFSQPCPQGANAAAWAANERAGIAACDQLQAQLNNLRNFRFPSASASSIGSGQSWFQTGMPPMSRPAPNKSVFTPFSPTSTSSWSSWFETGAPPMPYTAQQMIDQMNKAAAASQAAGQSSLQQNTNQALSQIQNLNTPLANPYAAASGEGINPDAKVLLSTTSAQDGPLTWGTMQNVPNRFDSNTAPMLDAGSLIRNTAESFGDNAIDTVKGTIAEVLGPAGTVLTNVPSTLQNIILPGIMNAASANADPSCNTIPDNLANLDGQAAASITNMHSGPSQFLSTMVSSSGGPAAAVTEYLQQQATEAYNSAIPWVAGQAGAAITSLTYTPPPAYVNSANDSTLQAALAEMTANAQTRSAVKSAYNDSVIIAGSVYKYVGPGITIYQKQIQSPDASVNAN